MFEKRVRSKLIELSFVIFIIKVISLSCNSHVRELPANFRELVSALIPPS